MSKLRLSIKKIFSNSYAIFIAKKAGFYLIVIFIALTFSFFIPRMMAGNPVDLLLRPSPNAAQTDQSWQDWNRTKHIMLEYFGLNKSLSDQYIEFWVNMFQFDLGTSYSSFPKPVSELIVPPLIFSFILVVPVLFVSFFIGNFLGARAAYLKGRLNDIVYYLLVFLQSAPFYWLALILLSIFVFQLHWFPKPDPGGVTPEIVDVTSMRYFLDLLAHYILPFLVLVVTFTGGWATGMRAMTLYEMESEYILYAEQLGFRSKTLRSYVQRNAILPQFTGLNLRLNELIGATLIMEYIFEWPGIGSFFLTAVIMRDYPLVIATTIVTLVVVVIGNFLVDITYGFVDPRIRAGYGG
ncbi:MAG: ABC transporter permease [Candidatus Hodarchaeota archaeon]